MLCPRCTKEEFGRRFNIVFGRRKSEGKAQGLMWKTSGIVQPTEFLGGIAEMKIMKILTTEIYVSKRH